MPVYSHSRLSTFETCPRQYYYHYVAKVRVEEEEGIEAFFGSLVHDALEKLYRDRMFSKVLTVDELVGSFNAEWDKRYHDGIVVVRKEFTPDDYRRVGEECLRKYHVRYAPFDQENTLALEERVSIQLDNEGRYTLVGYIDRLSQAPDGTYQIRDYKTNARLPSQEDKDQDRQLALYQIGIQNRWDDVTRVELIWHFVRFDKEIRSSRSKQQLDELRQGIITLIDDIESRSEIDDFETNESALCDWCSCQQVCPARKHLFETESLPPNRFLEDTGVDLVNHHVQLTEEVRDLKQRIDQLGQERQEVDEALLAYAEREGLEVIGGSTHEARVTESAKLVLPRKTYEPDEYAELEQLLRQSDAWSEVSAMDGSKLRRIWKEEDPDPGRICEIMKPFVAEDTERTLRFRARKSQDE